jgi:hypothetical protein
MLLAQLAVLGRDLRAGSSPALAQIALIIAIPSSCSFQFYGIGAKLHVSKRVFSKTGFV